MDETRYQEYWKLICALLNCPNGEEDDILKTNQYLIDDRLVKIILEIANALKVQGNLKSAHFLMNIAGYLIGVYRNLPLQKILTPTATYNKQNFDCQLDFCLKILQSSRDIKDFLNILSPLLQANLNQLNDNFAQLLRSWAITTLCSSTPQTSYCIAVNISNFSNLIKNFPLGNRAINLEIAMTGYEVIAIVITYSEYPYDWAIAKNNLGTVYLDRIRGDRVENLTAAIGYFHDALKIFTREAFPQEWAMTQNNLGISYLEMGTSCLGADFVYRTPKEQEEDLENAIRYLQNALEVNTHEAFPVDWAKNQHNLGLCYMHRVQGNHAENLEAAISCFSDVLQVYTREAFPLDWAWTQNTLGGVYRQRIQGDKTKNLNAAICYHLAALEVRTKKAFPSDHADTQYNLGICYQDARQFHNAYTAFAAAIDTIELLRGEIVLGTGKGEIKQKLAERWSKLYKQMVLVCLELGDRASAVEYVELSKTRNLVELILKRDLHTIFPSDIASQLEQLQNEIARGQYQLQTASTNDSTVLAQNLHKLRQQYNELQERYLPIGFSFKFDNFQKTLNDRTAVVQWYITSAKLIAFIFTRHTQQPIVWQSEPNGLKKFQKFSSRYRRAYYVYSSHWKRRLTNRLQLLAQILGINEIVKLIPQGCDRTITSSLTNSTKSFPR